ncbi:MAG: ACT domain-containing protein [Clostridiales bacterium]|nr:ACT domain-containing protein [Clostridiales bacterium]
MTRAHLTHELVVKLPNRIGLLADVGEVIREAGVNIIAIGAYRKEDRGEFMLVTSDNAAAAAALERLQADVTEHTAVAVELSDEPGALESVARAIAEAGIDMRWAYASVASGAGTALAIVKTEDDARAVNALT